LTELRLDAYECDRRCNRCDSRRPSLWLLVDVDVSEMLDTLRKREPAGLGGAAFS